MFAFSRHNPALTHPDDQPDFTAYIVHIESVPRSDRWRIYHRLQDLKVPCWCLADGSLHVEVRNSLGLLLLRSVVQQFRASRQEIVNWLESCWSID